jgi:hypothetical protein
MRFRILSWMEHRCSPGKTPRSRGHQPKQVSLHFPLLRFPYLLLNNLDHTSFASQTLPKAALSLKFLRKPGQHYFNSGENGGIC